MNELQQKLARRRQLNGESDSSTLKSSCDVPKASDVGKNLSSLSPPSDVKEDSISDGNSSLCLDFDKKAAEEKSVLMVLNECEKLSALSTEFNNNNFVNVECVTQEANETCPSSFTNNYDEKNMNDIIPCDTAPQSMNNDIRNVAVVCNIEIAVDQLNKISPEYETKSVTILHENDIKICSNEDEIQSNMISEPKSIAESNPIISAAEVSNQNAVDADVSPSKSSEHSIEDSIENKVNGSEESMDGKNQISCQGSVALSDTLYDITSNSNDHGLFSSSNSSDLFSNDDLSYASFESPHKSVLSDGLSKGSSPEKVSKSTVNPTSASGHSMIPPMSSPLKSPMSRTKSLGTPSFSGLEDIDLMLSQKDTFFDSLYSDFPILTNSDSKRSKRLPSNDASSGNLLAREMLGAVESEKSPISSAEEELAPLIRCSSSASANGDSGHSNLLEWKNEDSIEELRRKIDVLRADICRKDEQISQLEGQIADYRADSLLFGRHKSRRSLDFKSLDFLEKDDSENSEPSRSNFKDLREKYGLSSTSYEAVTAMESFLASTPSSSAKHGNAPRLSMTGATMLPSSSASLDNSFHSEEALESLMKSPETSSSSNGMDESNINNSMLNFSPQDLSHSLFVSSSYSSPQSGLPIETDTDVVDESIDTPIQEERVNLSLALINDDEIDIESLIPPAEEAMSYDEFIHRFGRSEAKDVSETTRQFISSILGPAGDGNPPKKKAKMDYQFHGTKHLEKRCVYFFDYMEEYFVKHKLWKNDSEEKIHSSRDCLERYVMNHIGKLAYSTVMDEEKDKLILRRMKLLSFVTPDALEIKPELQNNKLWNLAIAELAKINSVITPLEKAKFVVRCVAIVFRSLSSPSSSDSSNTLVGADDFLPVFIYLVLKSEIPELYSNCEYIQAFLNPLQMMSQVGYCMVNLRSAIDFIEYLDAERLKMDPDDFNRQLAEAEREMSANDEE